MADASVRAATPDDAAAIARVQREAWTQVYAGMLPADVLAAVGDEDSVAAWAQAAGTPPSPRHTVLVAVAGEEVVGFAAVAPSTDPDLRPGLDVEIAALSVAPGRAREGHGSRLVNAVADVMSGLGVAAVHVWVTERDEVLRAFLEKAGWAEDGAVRRLDLYGDADTVVTQRRLRVSIAEHE